MTDLDPPLGYRGMLIIAPEGLSVPSSVWGEHTFWVKSLGSLWGPFPRAQMAFDWQQEGMPSGRRQVVSS